MPEIVDGNNLIGRLGGGTRDGLVAEIAALARAKRTRVTIVFDGPPESGRAKVQSLGDVTVVYAAPRSADEEIVRRVRESRDPKAITVVTDDRVLTSIIAAAGARACGVAGFAQVARKRIERTASVESKAAGPVNLKDWASWFSDPKNRID